MTQEDKQRLLDELLKGVPAGTVAHRELQSLCLSELDKIEPIFDDILERNLRECISIIARAMTEQQRQAIARRLNERAAQVPTN